MPRVYLSEKEASALVVIVESYMAQYPHSCATEMLSKVPTRIARCIEMQGKKEKATARPRD